MKTKKKLLALGLALSMLAGCGNGTVGDSNSLEAQASSEAASS